MRWLVAGLFVLVSIVVQGGEVGVIASGFHEHALVALDEESFAVARGRQVEIRSWENLTAPNQVLRGAPERVCSLAASKDGRFLAAGDQGGYVTIWDLQTGRVQRQWRAHRFSVWTLCFSPNGALLASGSFDETVRLWDLASGMEVGVFTDPNLHRPDSGERAHTGWVRCVAFSPDGKILASSGCDGYVRLWDGETLRLLREPMKGGINIYSVAFSPDGKFIAWGYNPPAGDPGAIRLLQVGSWETISITGPKGSVHAIAFSPDGTMIASGGHSKRVQVWDVATGQLVQEFSGHTEPIWGVVFLSWDRLVSTARDGTVRLWTLTD